MRILLVEDDELVSKALEKILFSQNYVADVATNGETGWELVEAFTYDLILLDIVLPKLDGIRFCQRLRESGYQIPVLLLTAQDSNNDKVMGLDAGADDYVVKPFEVTELLARIRVLLRRNSSSTPVTLEWSRLCLDPGLCRVTYDGQLLSLTPKEYRLLELLLRNHHRVFSRSAILDHLWPCDQAPSEDAITVHIKDLRQKLKRAGAPSDFIETVYGQGYRLKQTEVSLESKNLEPEQSNQKPVQAQENLVCQQIKAELTTVWEKHRSLNQRRLAILEEASAKFLDSALGEEQRHEAQQIAHKLAGALGIFGFAEASQLAREIEAIFETCGVQGKLGQAPHLAQFLAALTKILEQSGNHLTLSGDYPQRQFSAGGSGCPVLLVIDDDADLLGAVVRLAIAQGISLQQVTLSDHRENWTSDVAILNFPLAHATARDLTRLAELANQTLPVPVLFLMAQNNLVNRVKVSHLAVHVCLQKPHLPEPVLEAIARVRSQIQAAVAKVMVVDDDAHVLTGMRTLLEPLGMRLTTLGEPRQFLPALEKCSPDLLVLDLKMPDFSGVQLCRALRNVGTMNQIFAAGANECISKTVGQSELATRILNTLERSRLHRVFANPTSR
jgi:DNA-binding response OmpR family regulator